MKRYGIKKDNEWNGEFFKRSVVYNPDRLDFTIKSKEPPFDHFEEIRKQMAQFTGVHPDYIKIEYDSNGIPRVTVLAPGSISNCEIEVTVKLDEETEETTHTFSAELPDGQIVTMPAPGAGWIKGETDEWARGDLRWKDMKKCGNCWEGYLEDFIGNPFEFEMLTEQSACWAKEMLQMDTPILSITTWTRPVVASESVKEQEPPYYCPSRESSIGLEVWPENGRPRRII
jgi:hypothetical protein